MSKNIKPLLILLLVAIIDLICFFLYHSNSKDDIFNGWGNFPLNVGYAFLDKKGNSEIPTNAEPVENNKAELEPLKIEIEASNIIELADKIKMETGEILSKNPYLNPSNCKLDLKNYSFSCELSESKDRKDFLKLGLYYGPTKSGCESCNSVMSKNPGSVVLTSGIGNDLVGQVIGLR